MLEREREMATLKTLGISDVIISKATSTENFVMGTIAGVTGILLAILSAFVTTNFHL